VPPHVAWIAIAPVKGLALLHPESVRLERFGVRENRRFHLIGEDGRLLNGKQLAPLVQIRAEWDEDARTLALGFPDGNVLEGEIALGETVSTSFYGRRMVEGRLVVGPWSQAISEFVGRPLRLVQPTEIGAGVDRAPGPVSILSTGSLEAMREAAGISEPIDPRRFRMLFGVEGIAPHEEDEWVGRRVRIGEAEVEVLGNTGRCLVTSRHPDSGARNLPTLDVLAEYRGEIDATERLAFGVYGSVTQPGVVRLGDPVEP
jgi:MOSC domain-containing protein